VLPKVALDNEIGTKGGIQTEVGRMEQDINAQERQGLKKDKKR